MSYVWKADKKVNNAKEEGRKSILLLHGISSPHFKAAETLPTYQNSPEKQSFGHMAIHLTSAFPPYDWLFELNIYIYIKMDNAQTSHALNFL